MLDWRKSCGLPDTSGRPGEAAVLARRGHRRGLSTLLATVGDVAHPSWRARSVGVYRLWRDAGYAIGALIGGITAALASLDAAVTVAAILTAISGLLTWAFMDETHPCRPARAASQART